MKITNDLTVKELKEKADEQGVTYNKNATAAQMQELLADKIETPELPKNTKDIDINAILKRMQEQDDVIKNLTNLVRNTGDTNKIKDFDKSKEELNRFSYSVKLLPTKDYDCPVIDWVMISNFVDLSEDKIKADQIVEITYLTKEGNKEKKQIGLNQFATFLKRSEKIIAKTIKNLDGTDVYISKKVNPDTKLEYYTMNPTEQTYEVTLEVSGQEITILSTYLNA